MFVAARNEHMPGVFGMIQVENFTPVLASFIVGLIATIFMLFMDVSSLIQFTGFLKWIFYGMNMISFVIFRFHKKYKDIHRPFRVPIFLSAIVFLAAIFIVVVPIVIDPQIEFLFAAIFIVVGFIFYVPLVHFKLRLGFMPDVTKFCQLYLKISTPVHNA
jgi:L-type amino acid transporter 9